MVANSRGLNPRALVGGAVAGVVVIFVVVLLLCLAAGASGSVAVVVGLFVGIFVGGGLGLLVAVWRAPRSSDVTAARGLAATHLPGSSAGDRERPGVSGAYAHASP